MFTVMSATGNLYPLLSNAATMRSWLSFTAVSASPDRWNMIPLVRLISTVTVVTSSPFTAALYVFTSISLLVYG